MIRGHSVSLGHVAGSLAVEARLNLRVHAPHCRAIEAEGVQALYINMNAADDEKRAAALATLNARFDESRAEGRKPYFRIVMHSLAFGSLVPFLADDPKDAVDRKKMEMTQDVMANSLVYWVQDLYRGGFLDRGSKIYAMTSEGTSRVVPSYGVVSGAKAALEAHIRQLAMEFARRDTGIAVNSIRAGVTDTPALRKIPEAARMVEITLARNPHGRLTTTQDVAEAIVSLSETDSDWISGNVIGVDGGEFGFGQPDARHQYAGARHRQNHRGADRALRPRVRHLRSGARRQGDCHSLQYSIGARSELLAQPVRASYNRSDSPGFAPRR